MSGTRWRNQREASTAAPTALATASAEDLVHETLAVIRSVDQGLRAFTHVDAAAAVRAARLLDSTELSAAPGVLRGTPIAIKATEANGSTQVQRLTAAGCVVVGTTSVPGPGTTWQTWGTTPRGDTVNPWDPGRVPGGSSAGAAAAVAAGLVRLATGTDGAGSIRIPAAWCGVLGLKTTRGLLPPRDRTGLTAPGVLARGAAEALAYLDVVAPQLREAEPVAAGRPRAVWSDCLGLDIDIHDAQRDLAHAAAQRLANLGMVTLTQPELTVPPAQRAWAAARAGTEHEDRARITAAVDGAFATADIVITPTTPYPPHGHRGPGEQLNVAFTWAFNLSGHPAVSVPAGHDADGLPVGVQLVGRHGSDRQLVQLAAALLP